MSLSATITIVGLGYGDHRARSLAAQQALDAAHKIILRTAIHPGIDDLVHDPGVVACDDIYSSSDSFESVYEAICDRVIQTAGLGPVVYAVPGSPAFGEQTVRGVRKLAKDAGFSVAVVPSVSGLDALAVAAGLDLLSDQVQVLDAIDISRTVEAEPFSGGQIGIDSARTVIVGQVFDRRIAGDLKHALSRLYPEDHQIVLIRSAGIGGDEEVIFLPLCELDHDLADHLTSVVIPPLPQLEASKSPATLHRIIGMLRSPEGCPWDRKQTHATLRDKIIEEAHEVAEAINAGDPEALAEELGDLLLLVALNAQIAEESGDFTIEEVYGHVNRKLVRRHPHVFGDVVAETPEAVLSTWKSVKAQEKPDRDSSPGALRYDQLPRSMSVIERIRRSEGIPPLEAGPGSSNVGAQLLQLIERAFSLGIDPELALESAYRSAKHADAGR